MAAFRAWPFMAFVAVGVMATAMVDAEPPVAGNTTITSFSKAKRTLLGIYHRHRETFYCGCAYDESKRVDHTSCGYVPIKDTKRSRRIEWEHVVPAEAFGQSFPEWREGHPKCVDRRGRSFKGRNCARKASMAFRRMEADMHNLVPAIGEVNARRSNFSMAMIAGEDRAFGACDVEIADRKVEPRPHVRGDVARTYLYMDAAYPGRGIVSRKNRRMFEAWATADPVDPWECERATAIAAVQGNTNAIVQQACRVAGIEPRDGDSTP